MTTTAPEPVLSVVLPAYNEAENVGKVLAEIAAVCRELELTYELIVVDDHSDDGTLEAVKSCGVDGARCLRLSRRSGSHTALRAGMQDARGQVVLCISADGQDDPNALREMIPAWRAGKQIVWAMRESRDEPFRQKVLALTFYKLLTTISQIDERFDIARIDFFLLDRRVVDSLKQCVERHTSVFGLLVWMGFEQGSVDYVRRDRFAGHSKWNFRSRFRLAFDWIIAFSGVPLRAMIYGGIGVSTLGFLYALVIIAKVLVFQGTVQGWASMIVVSLVMGGIQLIMLGLLGEYLWRTLDESRNRPIFFLEKRSDED